jgi:hypothetical protein
MTSKYDTREGWKLIDDETGNEIKVGDIRQTGRKGEDVEITWMQPPHKCSSQGKVSVKYVGESGWTQQFYASVVGGRYEYLGDES